MANEYKDKKIFNNFSCRKYFKKDSSYLNTVKQDKKIFNNHDPKKHFKNDNSNYAKIVGNNSSSYKAIDVSKYKKTGMYVKKSIPIEL